MAANGISGFGTDNPTESIDTSMLSIPPKLNCRLKSTYIESFGAFPDECPGGYNVTKLPIGAYSI